MLPTEDLFVYVYVLVDDAVISGAIAIPSRPGPVPACSDAELLAIALVRHLLGRRSEAGFLAEVRRDWGAAVPGLAASKRGEPADPLAVGCVRAIPGGAGEATARR
jgi:hypothetical protein